MENESPVFDTSTQHAFYLTRRGVCSIFMARGGINTRNAALAIHFDNLLSNTVRWPPAP